MTQSVFVYGTLRKDSPNCMFQLLASNSKYLGRARVHGRLYDLGDYPGVVPSVGEWRWVYGEVHTLEDPSEVLFQLDEYEGCGPNDPMPHAFERTVCDAMLEDGMVLQVWIYVYRASVSGRQEIGSGDYCRRAASQGWRRLRDGACW